MRRLTDTDGLTEFQRDILRTVRDFVDAEVLPVASELDHADAYPDGIVTRLKELGVFGLTIDEQYGGLGESLLTYALVVEELARGWMSLSGIINTHFHRRLPDRRARHARAEGLLPAQDGGRGGPQRAVHVRTGPRLGRRRDPHRRPARRRRLRHQRPEDVAYQRRHVQPGRAARPYRGGRWPAAPQPHRVPDREGTRVRRDAARASTSSWMASR